MSRWPWKKRHTPFLLAHLGILMMLFGAWLTDKYGIDGMLRVGEGEAASVVEFENRGTFAMTEGTTLRTLQIPWIPPMVGFTPMNLSARGFPYDLVVDQYMSHAEPVFNFLPVSAEKAAADPHRAPAPALKFRVSGGPMGISQEMWLWSGDPSWSKIQAGPAVFALGLPIEPRKGTPTLSLMPDKLALSFRAVSSSGKIVQGKIPYEKLSGQVLDPNWKNVKITFLEWLPDATALTSYKPSRTQYGTNAPPSAIHLTSGATRTGADVWLGLGERAILHRDGKIVEIAYLPQRFFLPFSIKLERFTIDHDVGTMNPSAFSSKVSVLDPNPLTPVTISMNEPLYHKGIAFYQASYEDGAPRPTTSILSVNRDPGRFWKYWGSLLIVGGAILLFAIKYWNAARARRGKPA